MKLYGIDYNVYAVGGTANILLFKDRSETELFSDEVEFCKRIIELKSKPYLQEIYPYEFEIDKSNRYELKI